MDKIKTVKIKNLDGSVSEESYSISVDAKNVDMLNGVDLQETIGNIDIDHDGNIATQLKKIKNYDDDIFALETDVQDLKDTNVEITTDITDLKANDIIMNNEIKKKAYFFDNVAAMKAANLKIGDYVCTLGYYNVNDGGAAEYKIVDSSSKYYELLDNTLQAELISKNNELNILCCGAKTDNSFDNYNILNNIMNLANYNIYIPKGIYCINSTLTITTPKKIYGEGTLMFTNASGDGLIVGDSIQLDGISIKARGAFVGTVLTYDGKLGTRHYPSTARFNNLMVSTNATNECECLFSFMPDRNFGIELNNIVLGDTQSDTRHSKYGFKSITTTWANSIIVNKMIIDIYGEQPFYLENASGVEGSGRQWTFNGLIIQARACVCKSIVHCKNMSFITFNECYIWDVQLTTFENPDVTNGNGIVIYEHCYTEYVANSASYFYREVATRINSQSGAKNPHYESYNSDWVNDVRTGITVRKQVTGDRDKIYPLFFPIFQMPYGINDIEIWTVYAWQVTDGGIFKATTRGNRVYNGHYQRDVVIWLNQYPDSLPFIYKLDKYVEGTVVWVRGGTDAYIRCNCALEPYVANGDKVHEFNTNNEITLQAQSINGMQPMTATTYPKWFNNATSVTTWS